MDAQSGWTLSCQQTAPGNVHTARLMPPPSVSEQRVTLPGSYTSSSHSPSTQPTISLHQYYGIDNGTEVHISVATSTQGGNTQTSIWMVYPDGMVRRAPVRQVR
jgi:hypothetical protein